MAKFSIPEINAWYAKRLLFYSPEELTKDKRRLLHERATFVYDSYLVKPQDGDIENGCKEVKRVLDIMDSKKLVVGNIPSQSGLIEGVCSGAAAASTSRTVIRQHGNCVGKPILYLTNCGISRWSELPKSSVSSFEILENEGNVWYSSISLDQIVVLDYE